MYYSWHGNIRQLKNAIEYSVVNAKGDMITIDDLPEDVIKEGTTELNEVKQKKKDFALNCVECIKNIWQEKDSLRFEEIKNNIIELTEKTMIELALEETKGNVEESAKIINLPSRTFYRLLKEYNIKPDKFRI
jgi:DNA-binding NtrC family response regulator